MPRRRTLGAPLTVLAVGALVAVTAVAVRVMAADANGCSSRDGIKLPVAAAPEIAPAVKDAADAWAESDPEVNGKCIQVEVRSVAPADMASTLAARGGGSIDVAAKPTPTPAGSDLPAVWIPDATSWIARVAAVDRSAFAELAPSLAMSPVVLAMPESVAAAMASQLKGGAEGVLAAALLDAEKAIQEQRAPALMIGIVDPRRDSASLGGAMLIREKVVTDESKVPNLIALFRLINKGRAPDLPTLQKMFGQGVKVAPMSEQTVIAFNAGNPPAPFAAIPLPAGGPSLDYPYVTLSGRPREVDAAAGKFRTALTSAQFHDRFARRGFRVPDGSAANGFPVGHGVTAQAASASPLDDPARVGSTLGLWSAANSPSKALAIIDVSSSINTPIAGTVTRLQVLQQAAIAGLTLFTDTSSLGMWTFTDVHRELSPIVPLSAANRAALNQKIAGVQAAGTDNSSLYSTLRDAYQLMTAGYEPGVANRIIVFTDGRNTDTTIKSLEALNRALETISVVTKPIEVTLIGVGPAVDMAELEEIARITGGVATRILDAADIRSVFLKALLE